MKTTIDPKSIKGPLNNCYLDYDREWDHRPARPEIIDGFKSYIEQTAGLKIDFSPAFDNLEICYKLSIVELVDRAKFIVWLLRWS